MTTRVKANETFRTFGKEVVTKGEIYEVRIEWETQYMIKVETNKYKAFVGKKEWFTVVE